MPGLAATLAYARQDMTDRLLEARTYTRAHGEDHPDIRDWTWPG